MVVLSFFLLTNWNEPKSLFHVDIKPPWGANKTCLPSRQYTMPDRGMKVSYSAVWNHRDHLVLHLTLKKRQLIIPDLFLLPLKRIRTTLREWPSYTSSVSNYYFFFSRCSNCKLCFQIRNLQRNSSPANSFFKFPRLNYLIPKAAWNCLPEMRAVVVLMIPAFESFSR